MVYCVDVSKRKRSVRPTYEIGHGLVFDPTRHTTWSTRFLGTNLIRIKQGPNGVVGVAKDPEVVTTHVGKLLEIVLVDPWNVKVFDKLVVSNWSARFLCRCRRRSEEDAANQREDVAVW